jgi:hypothetical protein
MNTKSVSSKPICPPKPAPAVPMAEGALQVPSASRATTIPLPYLADPRNPALMTVRIARPCASGYSCRVTAEFLDSERSEHTFAFASTEGGMILSGPKACRGSTKEVRIFPHFLHSAMVFVSYEVYKRTREAGMLTRHRRRQRVMDPHCMMVSSERQ